MIPLQIVHPVPQGRPRPGTRRTLGYARLSTPASLSEVSPDDLARSRRLDRWEHGGRLWRPLRSAGGPVGTADLAAWLSLSDTSSRAADDLRDAFRRSPIIAAWTDPPTRGLTRAPRASRGMPEAPAPSEEEAERARAVLRDWLGANLLACQGTVYRRIVPLWRLVPDEGRRPRVAQDDGHAMLPSSSPAVRGSLVRALAASWHPGIAFPEEDLAAAEASVDPRHEGDDDLVRLACALPDFVSEIAGPGPLADRLAANARRARLGWLLPGEAGAYLDLARAALAASDRPAARALLAPLAGFAIPRMVPRGEAFHDDEAELSGLAP